MIPFAAVSSFRAAAAASVRTNFEAFAGPAALWIALRSSSVRRKAKTHRSSRGVFFSWLSTVSTAAFTGLRVLGAVAFFVALGLLIVLLLSVQGQVHDPVLRQKLVRRAKLGQGEALRDHARAGVGW